MMTSWQAVRGLIGTLLVEERSQSTIEYALLSGIIAVAAISVLIRIRENMVGVFSTVEAALSGADVGPAP